MAPTTLVGLTALPVPNSTQRSHFACAAARVAWQVPQRGGRISSLAAAALQGAAALAIVTEWKEFRTPDFEAIKATLRTPAVFDGCNLYAPAVIASFGLEYHCIGRAGTVPDKQ